MMTVDRSAAFERRKFAKRVAAAVRNRGLCALCTMREPDAAPAHCRQLPDRGDGMCKVDGKLPAFRVDTVVLDEVGNGR